MQREPQPANQRGREYHPSGVDCRDGEWSGTGHDFPLHSRQSVRTFVTDPMTQCCGIKPDISMYCTMAKATPAVHARTNIAFPTIAFIGPPSPSVFVT
jgi:hypothetical protein